MSDFPSGLGNLDSLHLTHPPQRVVSLVPSLTETLFAFGLGERLVGVTDYCVQPPEAARLPKMGGPKTPHLTHIRAALPELILASQEENRQDDVEALQADGLRVWVTFPGTVAETFELLWAIVRVFNVPQMGQSLDMLERTYEWANLAAEGTPSARVFCPIWKDAHGWMTIGGDTYTHDLLRVCGGENIFGDLTRYPRVTTEQVLERAPEVIVLPSEPYAFAEADGAPFASTARLLPLDGSLLTWPGIRVARALAELPALLAPPPADE